MTNHCGECTACCRVFAIAEPAVTKKAGDWCQHCAIGKGCKIYDVRPRTCVEFECLWLLSQSRGPGEKLPDYLRPDRCKIVFSASTNPRVMAGTIMPGAHDALDRKGVRQVIEAMVGGGMAVVLGEPASTRRILLDKDGPHRVEMTEPDEDGMQWNITKD